MAQVRKYAKGNTIVKAAGGEPLLFTWDGYGDYDVADLEKTYAQNAENYVKSLGLNEEDSKKVLDRSYAILQAMKNGQIKNRNARGQWTNVPVGFESTGINEKGREKWWKRKDYIRDADFYNNLGYNIMDQVLRGTSTYVKPTNTTSNSKFNTNFGKYLSKYYFNNENGFDRGLWDFTNARTNIGARLADWRKEVEASDLDDKTKTDLLSRIDAGLAGLQSETTDDDYAALARLGFDARQWIDKDYVPSTSTSTEQPLTEEQKKQQEIVKNYQDYLKANRDSGDSYYFSQQLLRPNFDLTNYKGIIDYSAKNPVNWAEWTTNSDPQSFSNNFWAFFDQDRIKDLEDQGFYENGYYYIPQSVNETEGSIFRFNRNTNNIEKVPLSAFKKGVEKLEYLFGISAGTKKPWEYKEGGVIKAQQGWYVDNSANLRAKRLEESSAKDKAAKQQEAQQTKQSTSFENSNNPHTQFSAADKVRMGALAGDITSLILSMTGVGSVASAATGAASTTANAYADTLEGKSWGEALGDNAVSYGLDLVSLLPFAKAAKVPRMIKSIGKFAPTMTTLIAGYQGLANSDEYLKSWNKVTNGESLDVGDWRNILNSLQLVIGGTAATHRASKAKSNVEAARSNDKIWLKTSEGYRSVDKGIADKLSSAKTLDEQNKILEGTGIQLKEALNWKGQGKGVAKIKTQPLYDFSKPVKTYSGDLELTHNFGPGERVLGTLNPISLDWIHMPRGMRNWYNQVFHPQAYKRAKKSTSGSSTKPEVNAGNNKVVNDVNKATEEWWKQHGQQVNTVADDIVQVMRDAYLWRDTPSRLALPRKTTGPEIPSSGIYSMPERNIKNSKLIYNPKTGQWETLIYKKGGILKAASGTKITKYEKPAGPMPTGVGFANNTSWYGNVFTPMWKNILEGLKNRTFTYQDLNNMQSNHAKLYNAAGTNFLNQAYRDNAVGEYQTAYNTIGGGFGNTVGIANAYSTNRYMRGNNPISGDNPQQNYKVDNLYSGITDDRRLLGREGDFTPEQLKQITSDLNKIGYTINLNPEDKYYRINPLSLNAPSLATTPNIDNLNTDDLNPYRNDNSVAGTVELPEVEVTAPNSNRTGESGGLQTNSGGTKPQINWGDILGTARLAGTIWTNNRIAKGLKESLSPLLLDPVQLRRQVTGDLVTRNYMENLGAEANRIGARPITSDASLQLGQALDFNNRANEYRVKGYLADKQAIDKTTAEAQKVADFNKEQRVDVANRNRAAMLGIRQAKANIEAQRKSANWQQAIAPWLADKEMRWRENQKLNQALNYQENQYLYGDQYEQAAKAAQSVLDNAKSSYLSKEGNTEEGWLTSPEYKTASTTYQNSLDKAAKDYRDNMLKARKQAYTYNPFLFTFKSGGQLTYKEKSLLQQADAVNKSFLNDRKLFHKMITDSQKENNKLIMSLGSLTKDLIIKSMTYAG